MASMSAQGGARISRTDVLVVGAGPSGLVTSLLLARYGIKDLTVIDKRAIRVQTGHASGFQPRTQEILHSLGIFEDLAAGSGRVVDTAFWSSVGSDKGIQRASVAHEVTNATPYPRIMVQHQGRTEEILHRELEERGCQVRRPIEFLHYEYADDAEYPVKAYVKDIIRGDVEVIRCKYLVDAEGAASVALEIAAIKSSVHQTEDSWLVFEGAVDTDFPDFRRRSAIRTPNGNLMIIPSPHDTVRLYILMAKADIEELDQSLLYAPKRSNHRKTNQTSLLDVVNRRVPKIIHPYSMDIKEVVWISRYNVAQRIIDSFSDDKNVYFVGDSCHSHSPKAAQGMNTGIQDAYNLAWKLALTLRTRAKSNLLETYTVERKHIAHQLIDFDTNFAKLFGDQSKINSPDFHDLWKSSQGFTSGIGHQYPAGPLVHVDAPDCIDQNTVEPLTPGKRFMPMTLHRHLDGWKVSSLSDMPANGQFYEVVFAGDIASEPRKSEFEEFYGFLTSPTSALTRYNGKPTNERYGWEFEDVHTTGNKGSAKIIDLFVVHTSGRFSLDVRPAFETWKYRFYEDQDGVEHEIHGVDPKGDMIVAVVRPDGVVGMVCKAQDARQKVPTFFDSFMR